MTDRTRDLVAQAQGVLARADDPASLWRAYVAVEYAILDIKLRHGLEHEQSPPAPPKKAADDDDGDLLAFAREKLARLDLEGDRKKLLYNLRECRDALKALLARKKP
ncbi:hypothetical protein [Nitrososphaera viennensis]|uniref:HEPN domain-containing protein n=2 Tax=Nitrososphaera viennensis TaxID=1034015 RepID=A0A060HR36_9ARCH|nr:hypothetical protein [Nitrososphaera viennensis]AIC15966.1 hypothetical protein NVIE_017080 [Nitrososphaera viennensis EN76]UVS67942.1 hypothetical protein NWT39_08500 [Nitrososphaera viennensis]